jgi:hypothetical protein
VVSSTAKTSDHSLTVEPDQDHVLSTSNPVVNNISLTFESDLDHASLTFEPSPDHVSLTFDPMQTYKHTHKLILFHMTLPSVEGKK